jgi:choline dehydrogenase-like flavoprotein
MNPRTAMTREERHRGDPARSASAGDDPADVLVIGAGAAGAAVAWMLARAGIGVVCLEQGDWVDPRALPHWRPDWELHRHTNWSAEPNVRRLPQDYPVNDAGSPIAPLMYNAVGGSTIHGAPTSRASAPRTFACGASTVWPTTGPSTTRRSSPSST